MTTGATDRRVQAPPVWRKGLGERQEPNAQTLGDLEQFSRHTEAHVREYSVR